jgi:hypothetical protein
VTRTVVFRLAAIVAATAVAAACGGSPQQSAPAAAEAPKPAPEANYEPPSPEEAGGVPATAQSAATPTHGGMLVPVGSAYLEVVLDSATGTVSVFPLTATGMPTEASEVELQVTPEGGAPSRVTLAPSGAGLSGSLAGLKGATAFAGVVSKATIGGETHNNVAFTYAAAH